MTDAGWAERMVKFLESVMPLPVHKRRDALLKLSALLGAIREAEHARSVRIVKAVVKHAVHMEQRTKLNRELNAYWQGKLDGAENILAALQRSRGGKG